MKKFICLLLVLLLLPVISIQASDQDIEAPVITIIRNDVTIIEGEEFDYRDFFFVTDNSDKFRVISVGGEDLISVGKHEINIIAIDLSGNISNATLRINICTKQEATDIRNSLIFYPNYSEVLNQNFKAFKGETDARALEIAQTFLGMPGACNVIAQAFIDEFYGPEYSIFDTYDISYWDARPGDIIYYEDGGLGLQHYAIYLGGDEALHGNIYNCTYIKKVYMNYGSQPHFKRINNLPY